MTLGQRGVAERRVTIEHFGEGRYVGMSPPQILE
jgi:hypothetical protein